MNLDSDKRDLVKQVTALHDLIRADLNASYERWKDRAPQVHCDSCGTIHAHQQVVILALLAQVVQLALSIEDAPSEEEWMGDSQTIYRTMKSQMKTVATKQ